MGAVKRDSERKGKGESADVYCGCLMTGKEKKRKLRVQRVRRHVEGEVLRQNEKKKKKQGEGMCIAKEQRLCDFK